MNIEQVLTGHASGVRCRVRTGRAGRTGVDWGAPRVTALHLERDRAGRLSTLTVTDEDFAEFDPRHHAEADGELVCEDYYLQVLEVLG